MRWLVLLCLAACNRGHASPRPVDGVATVNGVAITELDLAYKLKSDMHVAELPPEHRKNILETVIRDELVLQRGIELGLDGDPGYREAVQKMEAQLAALKRQKMADLWFRHEIAAKVTVSDEEARRYFAAHEERIRTELHVRQILKRGREQIDATKQQLDAGQPFEALSFDLGWMKWSQVPPEWAGFIYTMQPGQVTPILSGPRERFWIVRLEGTRRSEITFEEARPILLEVLRGEKIAAARAAADQTLRARARIVVR
jgi:hypothetical protein